MRHYMTTTEAAELLDLNESHVRRLCGEGKIKGARIIGGRWAMPSPVERLPGNPLGRPRSTSK